MANGFSLHERAESLRRSAQADLAQAAGDRSLCVIAKSGKSFPMVKYHEGRAAALSMVIRGARSDTGDRAALDEIRRRFEAMTKLAAEDPDWEAYRHGGLEALDQLEVS